MKRDKSKKSFEKITNENQNANLAIQNNLASVKFSIQQNNDQTLTVQKKKSATKTLLFRSSPLNRVTIFRQLGKIKVSGLYTINDAPSPNQAKTDSSDIRN